MTIGGLIRAVGATAVAVATIGVPLTAATTFVNRGKRFTEKVRSVEDLDKENDLMKKKDSELDKNIKAYTSILSNYNKSVSDRLSAIESALEQKQ